MKKLMILTVITLMISVGLWAQSPADTVKKCVEALGGEAGIQKSLNFSADGIMKMSFGNMEFTGKIKTVRQGRKNWARVEIKFGGNTFVVFQAYDGKTAWMDRMNTVADQPSLNNESELDHTLTLLLEKDAKFSAGKATEIEGKKVIGLDVEFKGKKTTVYIDPDTHLPMEIVFTDEFFGQNNIKEMVDVRSRLLDYKTVDGVPFPMRIVRYQKGKKQVEMTFDNVTFNPKVAEDLFSRPDKAMDLRYGEEMMN